MRTDSVKIESMKIDISQDTLDDLQDRLKRTRWPGEIPGTGWSRGVDMSYMKELVEYWLDEYDWRKQEAKLNEFNHFKADINGLGIHFIREEGKGSNPMPLFMMHGYPWSFTMLLKIIPMLTDPASYGGDPEDAFTVVVPSLCGFAEDVQVSGPTRSLRDVCRLKITKRSFPAIQMKWRQNLPEITSRWDGLEQHVTLLS